MPFEFTSVYGVDFSGAKLAGRNIWIARAAPIAGGRLELCALDRLEDLAGSAEREAALGFLVDFIGQSDRALWGIDFPFGLPVEIMPADCTWDRQLEMVRRWDKAADEMGRWCVARAMELGEKMHIRRATDSETKTPFDCYHYRIIYQTFHGMRDVLAPLTHRGGTAIAPFQMPTEKTRRVVCEACPSSTLKRMGLPFQNYKQPAGGPLTARRRRTRHEILQGLSTRIDIAAGFRRTIMRNGGGDALDAVIAATGVDEAWRAADHDRVARHPRYRLEGFVYA
jgi:hypothetical protein